VADRERIAAEGWGLSLTEVRHCGTPAVATDIRGHRSSVVAGVTGVLVEPALLGATIADVLGDDRRRHELASAAAGASAHADLGRLGARHHQLPARRGRPFRGVASQRRACRHRPAYLQRA
jgi:glycosyltransferase involved in cell wall biosynthesis